MSWDHPVARTALELLLTSEAGNSSFGVWEGAPVKGILLESYAVVECIAPAALHSDRFLPVTPIRVQVDHTGEDQTDVYRVSADQLRSGDLHKLLSQDTFRRKILPMMLDRCHKLAAAQLQGVVDTALEESDAKLGLEVDRLVALKEINDHVSQNEIDALRQQQDELHHVISKARLRFDAVRVIWCQP